MRRRGLLAAPVGFVLLLVLVVTSRAPLLDLDRSVADGLNRVTSPHPALVSSWRAVSTVGQPLTFQVIAVVVALVLWRHFHRPRTAVFTAVTCVLTGTITNVVKLMVGRDRPTVPHPVAHAAASSFPSGHAMSSFVGVTVLLLVTAPHTRFRGPLIAAGALIVLAVGFSRLALGVHYLSDVVAGWLLGATWVWVARTLLLTRAPRVTARVGRGPRPTAPDRPPGPPVG